MKLKRTQLKVAFRSEQITEKITLVYVVLYVGIASKISQNWGFNPNFTNPKFKQIKYLSHFRRLGSSERHTFNQVVGSSNRRRKVVIKLGLDVVCRCGVGGV